MKNSRTISIIAVFSALAVIFTFIEIPYPPAPWLKFDISEVVILITVETLGLVPAIIVGGIKTFFQLFTGDTSPYNIGEITAFISSLTFALTFYFTKRLNIILRLLIVSIVFSTVMVFFNFFIATPVYMVGAADYTQVIDMNLEINIFDFNFVVDDTMSYLQFIVVIYVPFNFIKGLVISIIYLIIYKPVLKRFNHLIDK